MTNAMEVLIWPQTYQDLDGKYYFISACNHAPCKELYGYHKSEDYMNSITTEVLIKNDHKLNISIDLPEDYPIGTAIVTITIKPKTDHDQHTNRLAEIRGLGNGKVWMAEDFDAPLDDFAEYM
jgi:hypothetical protein